MKEIVYATDFSENSRLALRYAVELSRRAGARLTALYIQDSSVAEEKDLEGQYMARLQNFCMAHAGEGQEKEEILYEVRRARSAAEGILSFIEERNAELVVMGTRGENRLQELLAGSTAMGVIKKAGCPVLTVPAEGAYRELGSCIYAADFEEGDVEGIGLLADIAAMYEGEITVVHISGRQAYADQERMKWLRESLQERTGYPRINFELLLSGNVYRKLKEYAGQKKADLLCLLEREPGSAVEKWFHRSLVRRMEFHSSVPLLSMNEIYLMKVYDKRARLMEEIK